MIMGISVRIVALVIALASLQSVAGAAELVLSDKNDSWDPFKFGHVDKWYAALGNYSVTIPDGQPVKPENRRAVFKTQKDFDDYLKASDTGPKVKVLRTLRTEADRKAILDVVEHNDELVNSVFILSSAINLIPKVAARAWPVMLVAFVRDVLNDTEYAKHITKTKSRLADLLKVGGRIEHEERIYRSTVGDKPWMMHRSIVYRVKEGADERTVPLAVFTVRCEVAK